MKVEVALLGSSLVPNSPYGLCGRKATLNSKSYPSGEPIWPSGDALGFCEQKTSVLFRSGSPLSSKVGLWTPSYDFAPYIE